jgi:glycogen synthase
MRVLLLSDLYPPYIKGGAEVVTSAIARGLKDLDHEVMVLTSWYGLSKAQQDGPIWRTLHYASSAHFHLKHAPWQQFSQLNNYYRQYHNMENAKELLRVIKETNPDVLCIFEIYGIGMSSILKVLPEIKIPIVFYLQSYWWLYAHSPDTEQSRLRIPQLKKFIIGSVPTLTYTSLIAVSNAVKQEYVKAGCDPERTSVIHNGVGPLFLDTPLTRNSDGKDSATSHLDGCKAQLLFVGRLNIEKGVLVILKSLDMLVNKQGRQDLHLNIIGDGNKAYIDELKSFIQDKKLTSTVTFHGKIPQEKLIEYYDHADILIMPSLWQEPFALVTAEAMARELAVIASNVGGTSERITHNVDGLLVEPGDERALTSAIEQLLDNPEERERLAKAARLTVQERFTMDKCIQNMELHLQGILQKKQVSAVTTYVGNQ